MKILAIDDETLMLERLCKCINEAAPDAELVSFSRPSDVIKYIEGDSVDVAFLDIKMRGMDGIELGRQIKQVRPNVNIIFCTGYSDYIFDAVNKVRCSGYILKPVSTEGVVEELSNLRNPIEVRNVKDNGLYIQCFGNFEVFYNGKIVVFGSAKTKELFAYLIDRKGTLCSNNEVCAALWEDDKDHSAYYKKCRKDLHDTLTAIGCDDCIVKTWGGIAIDKNKINCDYYDWIDNKPDGIKAYNGSYMEQYSFGEVTRANIDSKRNES